MTKEACHCEKDSKPCHSESALQGEESQQSQLIIPPPFAEGARGWVNPKAKEMFRLRLNMTNKILIVILSIAKNLI
ncbi:hypothetical protein CQA66_08525 [Helicobacter aurati]|uniref:Uncharacterized protein n=2 Tax=Helicobacter aurati TaxID=137778 RepID=A0A3D8IZ32_9HELI|nr:hypothetical protein CQA66_08525 [Helicobacter aurati]